MLADCCLDTVTYLTLCLSVCSLLQLKEFTQISGGGAGPALARAVEIVEANVRWHSLYERQIFQWLRKSPNG